MTILSICIPSFNRLDCLENCLESILISSQNVKNFEFEVCISDNFSDKDQQYVWVGLHNDAIKIEHLVKSGYNFS